MNENAGGLSRRDLTSIKGFDPVLPELGKIKIGEKGQRRKSSKGNEFQPPQKLDHFKVVGLQRGPDNNLLIDKKLHEVIGPKPRELDIVFPYNDIDLNFTTFYAWYSSRTCRCKGNGEIAFRLDEATGEYKQLECVPATCPYHTPPEPKNKNERRPNAVCKPNGILSVIMMKAPRIGGVYKFRTTSYNTVRNILSSLAMIRQLTGGTLAGIPLKLTLKPQTVQPKGMSGAIVVYVVSVEWVGTLEALYAKALESAGLRAKSLTDLRGYEDQARKAITAGPVEDEQEIMEVAEEYYPEAVEAELVEDSGEPQTATETAEAPEATDAQTPEESPGESSSEDEPPPLDAYEETAPPPDLMDDAAPDANYDPETTPPEEPEKKSEAKSKTNKSKKRRI